MTLEGDDEWYNSLESNLPENAQLHSVSMVTAGECQESVEAVLTASHQTSFDIIVIDGLFRYEMIEIAVRYRAAGGAIICDNAEGYGFDRGFHDAGLLRVDFFGFAPGVVRPHCTSIYFDEHSFLFSPEIPIPDISRR